MRSASRKSSSRLSSISASRVAGSSRWLGIRKLRRWNSSVALPVRHVMLPSASSAASQPSHT
jgi:hypothetical protein